MPGRCREFPAPGPFAPGARPGEAWLQPRAATERRVPGEQPAAAAAAQQLRVELELGRQAFLGVPVAVQQLPVPWAQSAA